MPQEEKPSAKPTAEVDSSITEQMYSETPPIAEARQLAFPILTCLEKTKRGKTVDELVEELEKKKLMGECTRALIYQYVLLELGRLQDEQRVKVEWPLDS
jgi:hypothetical protein